MAETKFSESLTDPCTEKSCEQFLKVNLKKPLAKCFNNFSVFVKYLGPFNSQCETVFCVGCALSITHNQKTLSMDYRLDKWRIFVKNRPKKSLFSKHLHRLWHIFCPSSHKNGSDLCVGCTPTRSTTIGRWVWCFTLLKNNYGWFTERAKLWTIVKSERRKNALQIFCRIFHRLLNIYLAHQAHFRI